MKNRTIFDQAVSIRNYNTASNIVAMMVYVAPKFTKWDDHMRMYHYPNIKVSILSSPSFSKILKNILITIEKLEK